MLAALYLGFAFIILASLAVILSPVMLSDDFTLRQRSYAAAAISVLFIGGVCTIYTAVGAPDVVQLSHEREAMMRVIKQNITQFAQKLKESPQSWESWMGMGDNFSLTGQRKAAVNAYKQAVRISGGRPDVILAYSRAMIAEADGTVSDHSKKSLEMVIMQDKENAEARYWLAVRLLQEGKQPEAMAAMRSLYRSLQNDDPVRKMIDRQIGRGK